jgi:hypothetical protein
LNLLRKLYPNTTTLEVANKIGRTAAAVRHRVAILGLKRKYRQRKRL